MSAVLTYGAATLAFVVLTLAATASPAAEEAPVVLPIPNGGFEEGPRGWFVPKGEGMSQVTTERAAAGRFSLKIRDTHGKNGSSVTSELVSIQGAVGSTTWSARGGAGAFELRGKIYPVSGSGLGMYVRILDAARKQLNEGSDHLRGLGGSDRRWKPFAIAFYTTKKARFLQFHIHSYSHARVEAYLDELEVVMLPSKGIKPPWEAQYKIKPEEKDRLTPADVVGPDGIVYPNWKSTGVQGGIPKVRTVARIEDFGGRADDDKDDSQALQEAVDTLGERGGGALLFGRGTYCLDRPVTVRHSGVVIRGKGADKTRLIFRYALGERGVDFYWPPSGSRVGRGTRVELHASPGGLQKLTVKVDDRVLGTWTRSKHSGNTFYYTRWGRQIVGKLPDGEHTLTGIAEYKDGKKLTRSIPVVLDRSFDDRRPVAEPRAAICFKGRGRVGPKLLLAADGRRGAMTLELESARGLAAGDCILIEGPATKRWKALTKNACKWGMYRRYEVLVDRVAGKTITIRQPLRIEFPTIDGSFVQKVVPIQRCGIEDLYIEQTENLWITTVEFRDAWNSWARGVRVRMCGRNPVYGAQAKWCEIRDCVFDDAHFKGGGGTAYAGWENCWDCLAENIETFKLRHAPLFQWAASGNVIRKSVFHESDGQWHSGWTNENLFEQCVIASVRGHGGYGYGFWGSPPEDTAHGPNGPRNVIYNCDVDSQRTGLWMGGMNESWLVLYNRFVVERGEGVFAKTASFDHIVKGNVFVLKDRRSPMVMLATPDCTGVEVVGNVLFGGNGEFTAGGGEPALVEGNKSFPLRDAPRPAPAVPSIYEWQQRRK